MAAFLFAFFPSVLNNLERFSNNIELTRDFTVCLTAPAAVHTHHCLEPLDLLPLVICCVYSARCRVYGDSSASGP